MARNAGLRHSHGAFLAFLDDDEVATESWLAQLLQTQVRSGADVVFGPVRPRLPAMTDAMQRALAQFMAGNLTDCPTGTRVGSTIVTPFWSRGKRAYPALATNNCLIALQSHSVEGVRFDDRLGLFGGEDALYFIQLATRGASFVWCAEAVAWEHIPPERLHLRYILARAIRGGQVTSLVPLLLSPARPRLTALAMATALAQAPVYAFLLGAAILTASPRRYHHLTRLAGAVGKLFWMRPFRGGVWPSWHTRA